MRHRAAWLKLTRSTVHDKMGLSHTGPWALHKRQAVSHTTRKGVM